MVEWIPAAILIQFALGFNFMCAPSSSRVFFGGKCRAPQPNFVFCRGFSDLPRAPAPLYDHGLLDLRVNVRIATTVSPQT